MWPAECVYCNTIHPNPVLRHCCWCWCCFCMAALVKSWVHLRKVCGQSIRWPHDNLRFLRHARKPAPVHVIMHNLPECLPPFSTNCSLLTALPSIIASVVLFAMLLLHRNELHTWGEKLHTCVEGEIVCNPLQAFHHPRYNERHCDHQGWEQMILRIRQCIIKAFYEDEVFMALLVIIVFLLSTSDSSWTILTCRTLFSSSTLTTRTSTSSSTTASSMQSKTSVKRGRTRLRGKNWKGWDMNRKGGRIYSLTFGSFRCSIF